MTHLQGHHNGTRTSTRMCQAEGCHKRAEPTARLCVQCELEGRKPVRLVAMCALCGKRPAATDKSLYCSEACANTASKGMKALKLAKRDAALAAARRQVR